MSSSPYHHAPQRPLRALSEDPTTAEAALAYGGAGWPVLLLHGVNASGRCTCGRAGCPSPGKHPLAAACPNGVHDATTDAAVLGEWVTRFPRGNVAIRTGTGPEGADLVVLDVDPRHGGDEALWELERAHGPLPDTVEAITGGLGRHLYFEAPEGLRIRSSAGGLGPGLDVRGEASFAVASPSRHASGRRYVWEWSSHPAEVAPAPIPDWLLARLTAPVAANGTPTGTPWAARLLREGAPQGQRNEACFRLACFFRRYGVPTDVIAAICLAYAGRCRPALDEAEVLATVSGVCKRYPPGQELDW